MGDGEDSDDEPLANRFAGKAESEQAQNEGNEPPKARGANSVHQREGRENEQSNRKKADNTKRGRNSKKKSSRKRSEQQEEEGEAAAVKEEGGEGKGANGSNANEQLAAGEVKAQNDQGGGGQGGAKSGSQAKGKAKGQSKSSQEGEGEQRKFELPGQRLEPPPEVRRHPPSLLPWSSVSNQPRGVAGEPGEEVL